jgi:exodeoxyribonuclease V alpha subunit
VAGSGEVVVEGEVERVTFESAASSFRVVKIAVEGRRDRLAVVGQFPPLAVGARVRARGRMVNDAKHGEQLQASSVTELGPSTLAGVEKYLGSGIVKGIGGTYAKRIVAVFGMDTLRVLDETPERLREVEGLGAKRIESITKGWREQRAIRDVMVFLQAHGASPALAARIYKRYGPQSAAVVSREPYRLAIDVWGVGFKTADKLAESLGVARDSPQRFEAAVLQAIRDARDTGHVYVPDAELAAKGAALLEVDAEDEKVRGSLARAIDALALGGYVVPERPSPPSPLSHEGRGGGERVIYSIEMHAAESRLARRLVELAAATAKPVAGAERALADFEKGTGVELAPEQRAAVSAAAAERVVVVTGGPGVGKTTIVRAMLATFARAGLSVRLAAPTGRAAKRMTEATGHEASTLHRLLEFDPKTARFKRGAQSPIEGDVIVVDEASMIDVEMADSLTQATAPGARLVLVGDVDQLPSVGPGAVLRDVIASGKVVCVRLTRIFRQAHESLIVVNAHRIHDGEAPITPAQGDDKADFFVIDRRDPEAARKTIVELVTARIPQRFGLDPVRDVQVLAPMHRGPCGSVALNEALQAALNPRGAELALGARTLRVGDKVMQLKNDYDRNVWNGDVGVVSSIEPEEDSLVVRFDAEREVPYERGALDELSLAYACSVHKAQGSEYPAVVVPLLTSHFVMLSRNLLYTAVTRGKRLVVLVCDPRAITIALAEDRKDERRTRLASRLREAAQAGQAGRVAL